MGIALGIVRISQYMTEMSQLPVSFDAVPDIQGCPCVPREVGVDSVSIQLGSPENVEITAEMETVSQPICEISQFPVSIDTIPYVRGCPCLPMKVRVGRSTTQLGNPEYTRIAAGITCITHFREDDNFFPPFPGQIPP